MEGCWKLRNPLKGPMHILAVSQSFTLSSSKELVSQKVPETYKGKTDLCVFRVKAAIVPVLSIPPTQLQGQADARSEPSLT